jgi:hypothetical protein
VKQKGGGARLQTTEQQQGKAQPYPRVSYIPTYATSLGNFLVIVCP